MTPTNCTECAFHAVLPDPDPWDSFCSDDVKVVCRKASRVVAVAVRPHHVAREALCPPWCPLTERSDA